MTLPQPYIILVVDAVPASMQFIAELLNSEGHYILQAVNVAEAQLLLGQVLPDLILLDVASPDPDGVSLAHNLRSASTTRCIPIIILTAPKMECDTQWASDAGVIILPKPFTPSTLARKIREVLDG